MSKPVLSIIIPAYNAGSYIKKIVTKILNQGIKNIELIVVDDGSSDNTINVLRGIQSKDKRLVVLSKKNGGPSSARNLGIKKSKGKYIMFVDSDDDISTNLFGRMIAAIEESDSDVVVCGWRVDLNKDDQLVKGYKRISPAEELVSDNDTNLKEFVLRSIGNDGTLYNLWNKIFKAEVIKDNTLLFREDLRFGEDLVFFLQYIGFSSKLMLIPDILYFYRADSSSSVFSKSSLDSEYRVENLKELATFSDSDNEKIRDLSSWVRYRWLISYSIRLAYSDFSFSKKISLIKPVLNATNPPADSTKNIGLKRLVAERFIGALSSQPWIIILMGQALSLVKKLIITLRLVIS